MSREEQLYLMAFGRVHVDEPGVGVQDLQPGAYDCAAGTTVATDADSQALDLSPRHSPSSPLLHRSLTVSSP